MELCDLGKNIRRASTSNSRSQVEGYQWDSIIKFGSYFYYATTIPHLQWSIAFHNYFSEKNSDNSDVTGYHSLWCPPLSLRYHFVDWKEPLHRAYRWKEADRKIKEIDDVLKEHLEISRVFQRNQETSTVLLQKRKRVYA